MEIRIIYFYPDLMSLYGSYANVTVLRRRLELLGHTVCVEAVQPGEDVPLTDAAFLFMGAGTERAQKAALEDLRRYAAPLKDAAAAGVPMLFCGTAMELLGASITDAAGKTYPGIGLAPFTSVQGSKRITGDVYGLTDLYPEPVVGFMNKCSVISGVDTPLLTALDMGWGNDGPKTGEGFHQGNVFASQLTGPLLVKDPRMLDAVTAAVYSHLGLSLPGELPRDPWAEAGFQITEEQLRLRCGK